MRDASWWIEKLELAPHPEGGHFRETYRSPLEIGDGCLPGTFEGRRSLSTAIYYLLRGEERSLLHRIRSDEVWHFHDGGPLALHVLHPDGSYELKRIGVGGSEAAIPQAVVPAGAWFGAHVDDECSFSLVGCTVAPGFDFRDFETADRAELIRSFPGHRAVIERLTG